jgi:hypothetical protein
MAPVPPELTYAQWALRRMVRAFVEVPPDWEEIFAMADELIRDCLPARDQHAGDMHEAITQAVNCAVVINMCERSELDRMKAATQEALEVVEAVDAGRPLSETSYRPLFR